MSKRKPRRPRQLARPIYYKQAGAVEEALRQRGVSAHVQPGALGLSLLVHIADPDVPATYLDDYADTLAAALYADGVAINSAGRTFIVTPTAPGPDAWAEDEEEDEEEAAAWPPAAAAEPAPAARPAAAEAETALWADYVKLRRLTEALDDLQRALVSIELRADASVLLQLTGDCNPAAVRGQLAGRKPAIAAALGAASCLIIGRDRQITIIPGPQPGPAMAPGAARR